MAEGTPNLDTRSYVFNKQVRRIEEAEFCWVNLYVKNLLLYLLSNYTYIIYDPISIWDQFLSWSKNL